MTRSTWSDYDEWEARDRTALEAFYLAHQREIDARVQQRLDDFARYGAAYVLSTPDGYVRIDPRDVEPVRYPPPSPAEELPLDL